MSSVLIVTTWTVCSSFGTDICRVSNSLNQDEMLRRRVTWRLIRTQSVSQLPMYVSNNSSERVKYGIMMMEQELMDLIENAQLYVKTGKFIISKLGEVN